MRAFRTLAVGITTAQSFLVLAVSLFPAGVAVVSAQEEGGLDPVSAAFEKCAAAPLETQKGVVAEIARRIEESGHEGIRRVLELRDEARRELKKGEAQRIGYHEPEMFAPGQNVVRRYVDETSNDLKLNLATYRTWESEYPFAARIRYDYGTNLAYDALAAGSAPLVPTPASPGAGPGRGSGSGSGHKNKAAAETDGSPGDPDPAGDETDLAAIDRLWNYLYGYPPDGDVLVAWLEQQLDHDSRFDPYALHFAHPYCDLDGRCYRGITLYDAFASREKIDMPDIDVIPFARAILKDHSFRSPIPPGKRRDELYASIKRGFLPYFQHRTFVEAAATLYLDPEAPLRPEHEPLRQRLLYLFSIKKGEVKEIRDFVRAAKDRAGFIEKIDALQLADPMMEKHRKAYAEQRNAVRWAVAEIAYAVLREHGFLEDR